MGQVPKNNIIKALEGATLTMKVNGVLKKVPVEKADEAMSKEADRLIDVGELRLSEKVAYMNSWNKVKSMSGTGEFSFDTAGKDFASDINYKGAPTSFGMVNGKASERGHLGSAFTKKARRDNVADIEAIVTRTAFAQLGKLSLEGDEAETALKTKTAEAAKVAAEKKAQTTKPAATTDEFATVPFNSFYGGQFGGSKSWGEAFNSLPTEEKEKMMRKHMELIMPNWDKYSQLKEVGQDWLTKYKGTDGALAYSPALYKDFYTRALGGEGLDFYNRAYGTAGDVTLTPEEKIEADKEQITAQQDEELGWKSDRGAPNVKLLDDNTIEYDTNTHSKILNNDLAKVMRRRRVWDPAKKKVVDQLVVYPTKHNILGPTQTIIYNAVTDQVTGRPLYVNQKDPNDYFEESNLRDAVAEEEDMPMLSRLYAHKSGGTIQKMQAGDRFVPTKVRRLPTGNITSPVNSNSASTPDKTAKQLAQEELANSKSKSVSEIWNDKWTVEDEMELGAIAADIGGAVAGFFPGAGNVVSGLSGMGATILGATADARRKKDFSTGDALMTGANLALDAASLVPGIGLLAKQAKIVKHLPKIHRLLLLGGLASEAYAVQDMMQNGVTMEGIRKVAGGLNMLSGMKGNRRLQNATEISTGNGESIVKAVNTKTNVVEEVPATFDAVSNKWSLVTPNADLKIVPEVKTNIWGKEKVATIGNNSTVVVKPNFGEALTEQGYAKGTSRVKHEVGYRDKLNKMGINPVPKKATAPPPAENVATGTPPPTNTGEAPVVKVDEVTPPLNTVKVDEVQAPAAVETPKVEAPKVEEVKAAAPESKTVGEPKKSAEELKAERDKKLKGGDDERKALAKQRLMEADAKIKSKPKPVEVLKAEKTKKLESPVNERLAAAEKRKAAALDQKKSNVEYVPKRRALGDVPIIKTAAPVEPTGIVIPPKPVGARKEILPSPTKPKEEVSVNNPHKRAAYKNPHIFLKGGKIIKGEGGLASDWANALDYRRVPMIGAELPTSTSVFPSIERKPMGLSSTYGTGELLLRDKNRPFIGATPQNVSKLLPSRPAYNGPMTGGMAPMSTINALSGRIKTTPIDTKAKLGGTKMDQAGNKNPTLFEGLKISPEQGVAASEALRTLFLNNALDKQKQTKLYTPQIANVVENRIGVHGDLLTKNMYDAKANEIRNSATQHNLSSDPRLNAAMMSQANQTALSLEGQGAAGFAQGIEKSRQMDLQNTAAQNQARKQNADLQSQYLQKGLMYRDQFNTDINARKALNTGTFWQDRNIRRDQDIAEKKQGVRSAQLEEKVAALDKDPKYINIIARSAKDPDNIELATLRNEYLKAIREARNEVNYGVLPSRKGGGSLPSKYKHDLMLYKEDNTFKKEIANAINRWNDKQGNRTFAASARSSKELNDMVSKLFSK